MILSLIHIFITTQTPDAKPRALIAMSGGVDSSVAACLMQQAGYDLSLIHISGQNIYCPPDLQEPLRPQQRQRTGAPLRPKGLQKPGQTKNMIPVVVDVYKRQPDGLFVALGIAVLLVAVHLVRMAGVAAPQPLGPVSYTHLDVYKRQFLPGSA